MDARTLRSSLETIDKLPTIPPVLKRLLDLIEDPKTSLNEIGNFIAKDPSLASTVLKAINSPVYGFPGRISTTSQALILLGLNFVKGLLLSITVFEIMQKIMAGLREHSVGCAITARIISRKKSVDCFEEIAVAALLHDIGKVVLALKFPSEYKKIIREATERGTFIFDAEKDHFGVDHCVAGAWLLEKWQFPRTLIEVVECHHKPRFSKNAALQTSIVHMADVLVRAKGFGFSGDGLVPAVDTAVMKTLDLSEDDMKEIIKEMEDSLENIDAFQLVDMKS